jgi:hypothetical protein
MAKLPPRRVADVRAIPGFPYVSDEYAMAIGYVADEARTNGPFL